MLELSLRDDDLPDPKLRVNLTSTGPSLGNRPGSSGELPMVNRPGGHQMNFIFMPLSSRTSPAGRAGSAGTEGVADGAAGIWWGA